MQKVWYIHGANATPTSFTFIKMQLKAAGVKHDIVNVQYITEEPLAHTLQDLEKWLTDEPEPVHIISHSLGGILAVALSQRCPDKVLSVTTMSTPFAGSDGATKALFIKPLDPFLLNASSLNRTINKTKLGETNVPLLKIITTSGCSSLMSEPNDGVVTVASQCAYPHGTTVSVELNHFEVLLSHDVVDHVVAFVGKHATG